MFAAELADERTDAADEHRLTAGHVANGAEQVVRHRLGSAGNKCRMTVADVEDAGHLQAALLAGVERSPACG